MPGWIDGRFATTDRQLEWQYQQILALQQQLRAVQQGLIAAQQQGNNGGGQLGGAGAYSFMPSSSMASGGNPPSGTPTSLTGTVYQQVNGAWITLSGTYTIYNGTPNTIDPGLQCGLVPDGAGNFVIYFQSCT
jgi:hypothetical protein